MSQAPLSKEQMTLVVTRNRYKGGELKRRIVNVKRTPKRIKVLNPGYGGPVWFDLKGSDLSSHRWQLMYRYHLEPL